jgi:cell division protein FtsB
MRFLVMLVAVVCLFLSSCEVVTPHTSRAISESGQLEELHQQTKQLERQTEAIEQLTDAVEKLAKPQVNLQN